MKMNPSIGKPRFTDRALWRLVINPLLFCLVFIFVQVSVSISCRLFFAIQFGDKPDLIQGMESVYCPIIYSALLIVIFSFYLHARHQRRGIETSLERLSVRGYIFVFFAAFTAVAVSGLFMLAMQKMAEHITFVSDKMAEYQELMSQFTMTKQHSVVGLVFSLAVMVPICEELLFRGIIMEEWLRFTRPSVAILMQALIFSVMHMNFVQSAYVLLIGVMIGIIYYYTRSLAASILLHMIFNFVGGVIPSVLPVKEINMESLGTPEIVQMCTTFFSWLSIPIFLFMFFKYRKKKHLLIKTA